MFIVWCCGGHTRFSYHSGSLPDRYYAGWSRLVLMAVVLLVPDRNDASRMFFLLGVCGPDRDYFIKRGSRLMLNVIHAIGTVQILITDSSHLRKRTRRDAMGSFIRVLSLDHALTSSMICSSLCSGNVIGEGECAVNIPCFHCNIDCGCVMLNNSMSDYLCNPALKRIPVAASPIA